MKTASDDAGFAVITGKRAQDAFIAEINKLRMQNVTKELKENILKINNGK